MQERDAECSVVTYFLKIIEAYIQKLDKSYICIFTKYVPHATTQSRSGLSPSAAPYALPHPPEVTPTLTSDTTDSAAWFQLPGTLGRKPVRELLPGWRLSPRVSVGFTGSGV